MTQVQEVLNGRNVVFLRDGEEVYASADSGIKPLVAALESGKDFSGCAAFDKIAGKAAAMLYLLLGVSSVGACVMTRKAQSILRSSGIDCAADEYVDAITNRRGDGLCPMELTVADIDDATSAYDAVREKLKSLGRATK